MALVKKYNDFAGSKKINEGWAGVEGNKAYNQITAAFDDMSGEQIAQAIWNYFDSNVIKDFYNFLIDEGFIDDEGIDD